jgi:hypothetical protein
MTDTESGDVTIPRIAIRDSDDALFVVMAIRTHMFALIAANERAAKRPGADQLALSLQTIKETQYATDLMNAITDGIVDTVSSTNTEEI